MYISINFIYSFHYTFDYKKKLWSSPVMTNMENLETKSHLAPKCLILEASGFIDILIA